MKNLIFNAFAYIDNYESGVNVRNLSFEEKKIVYLKNICVSLFTAKRHNPDDEVALITNCEIPEKYNDFLKSENIQIFFCPYTHFEFPANYKWSLAFYKLCALKYAIEELDYDNYCMMDLDTVTIKSFQNIWIECTRRILLFDIQHSLDNYQCKKMNDEYRTLFHEEAMLTNYGGEFIAVNKSLGKTWISGCQQIYEKIKKEKFLTNHGDEFIISSVAYSIPQLIKSANPYISRYWTLRNFYRCSTDYYYDQVSILHLPSEKNSGFLKMYRYITDRRQLPTMRIMQRVFTLAPIRNYRVLVKKICAKLGL